MTYMILPVFQLYRSRSNPGRRSSATRAIVLPIQCWAQFGREAEDLMIVGHLPFTFYPFRFRFPGLYIHIPL